MRVVSLWWQILINPESRRLDDALERRAPRRRSRRATRGRGASRSAREAWFYLAGSYAPLVQWRVLRGERLAAAREGKKIKDALERALELDPTLNDAYFGIGLYHYYADVAPAAAKMLRFLLFLPGGDRAQGLKEMLRAREHGELLRGEADYQLQRRVSLVRAASPAKALELLERLDARYPNNPLFLRAHRGDPGRVLSRSSAPAPPPGATLLDRARAGRVHAPAQTEVRARIGLAVELDAMFETDRAIDELTKALRAPATAMPEGSRARAAQLLGNAQDRLGHHDLAVSAYATAVAAAPEDDPQHIREQVRAAERQKIDPRKAESYRLSLEGWRALERGAGDEAATALEQALDARARRRGRALPLCARPRSAWRHRARARGARARHRRAPVAPAIVLASAFTDCARLLERSGETTRALALYRYAVAVVGGDPRAHSDAVRGVKRLAGGGGFTNF